MFVQVSLISVQLLFLILMPLTLKAEVTDQGVIERSLRPQARPESPIPNIRPRARPMGNRNIVDMSTQAMTRINLTADYRHIVPESGLLADHCVGEDQYFKTDGTLGSKGQLLRRELASEAGAQSTPMRHLFFRNTYPENTICPNLSSMTDDQKLNYWIWYMASIAEMESDCGRNSYNPNGSDGVASGEFQLNEDWDSRKWRGLNDARREGGGCNVTGPKVTPPSYAYSSPPQLLMANIENNIPCAVEILAGGLCGFYSTNSGRCLDETRPLTGLGYWQDIRNETGEIMTNLRSFPLCN